MIVIHNPSGILVEYKVDNFINYLQNGIEEL